MCISISNSIICLFSDLYLLTIKRKRAANMKFMPTKPPVVSRVCDTVQDSHKLRLLIIRDLSPILGLDQDSLHSLACGIDDALELHGISWDLWSSYRFLWHGILSASIGSEWPDEHRVFPSVWERREYEHGWLMYMYAKETP